MSTGGQGIGILSVLFAALVWGTTGTAARFAPEVSPLAIGSAAMGLGGLAQALIAAPAIKQGRAALARMPGLWLGGALAVAAYPLAFYSGMHLAGVTIGTLVMAAAAPIFAALIEWALDRRRPDARWGLSALLSVLGMLALALARGEGGGAEAQRAGAIAGQTVDQLTGQLAGLGQGAGLSWGAPGSAVWPGIALALLAGLTYAAYSYTARRMMLRGLRPKAAMGATFGLGGLLLMPVLWLTGAPLLASGGNFAVGAYMALVPMLLGYIAFGAGLARIPASMATMLTLFEPVVAALLALVLLGERLAPLGWLGVALVGAGLVLLSLPRRGRAAG